MRVPRNTFHGLQTKATSQLPSRPWADALDDDSQWSHGQKDYPINPYAQVVALNAAVSLKCNSMAMVPVRLSNADDQVIESGADVELLARPNPVTTWPQFVKDTIGFLSVRGRVYWWRVTNGSRVLEVYVLNPKQLKPICNDAGELIQWHYKSIASVDSDVIVIDPDDVNEIKYRDYGGIDMLGHAVSPVDLASQSILQVHKAHAANGASLDNGMEPGGLLKLPGTPTDKQLRDIRQEVNERHTGVGNRRKFMLMYGGMEFQPMQAMFKDMEFSVLLRMNREEICVSQGVPPLLIYSSGQSSLGSGKELESHKLTFWESTLMPLCFVVAENWSMFIVGYNANDQSYRSKATRTARMKRPQCCNKVYKQAKLTARAIDRELFVWFDTSVVPVIQASALEQAKQAAEWHDRGVPMNDILDAFDLPFEKQPWGDTVFIEASKIDIRVALGLIENPHTPEPPEPPAPEPQAPKTPAPETQQLPKPVAGGGALDAPPTNDKFVSREEKIYRRTITKALSGERRAAMWKDWYQSWAPLRKQAENKIRRHFQNLRKQVLTKASQIKTIKGIHTKDLITDILFDLQAANNGLLELVGPLINQGFELGGQQAMNEDAAARGREQVDPFAIEDPRVVRSITKRKTKLVDINHTLRTELRTRMAKAVADGEGTASLTQAIREQFNISTARAKTIAITEIGGAVEESRQFGRVQAKVPGKSWLSSRAEKGRVNHRLTEDATMAKPVPTKEKFTIAVTGVKAMYPRGSGVASEDIRCGCTTIARYLNDKKYDLRNIHHLQQKGFTTFNQFCTSKGITA